MSVIYKTNPNYSAQTISGITVIIPISEQCPKFNGMMKLTGVGPFLWNVFNKGATIDEACGLVLDEYDALESDVVRDVRLFVSSLLENGLLFETEK